MPARTAPKKRNVPKEVAVERARKAAYARNQPDSYIRSLEAAELTTAQKRRLAALLMPFLGDGEHDAA
jgi:hypothetical protein